MLFRLLLILNVLLASVQGAPIGNRIHRFGAQNRIRAGNGGDLRYGPCSVTCGIGTREVYLTQGCPGNMDICFLRMEECEGPEKCGLDNNVLTNISQDTLIKILIVAAIVFIVVAIVFIVVLTIGAIFAIIYIYLKKNKQKKDAESQWYADDGGESNTKLNGKHEDDITITIEDSPPETMEEKRDVLTDIETSLPGPPGKVINVSPDEDVVTSSDRENEDDIKIVIDDVPHGPVAEKVEVIEDTKIDMDVSKDKIINISPEDVVTSSDRDDELYHSIPFLPMPGFDKLLIERKEADSGLGLCSHPWK